MWLRPQSTHQWRQCDSAAYCLNYFQNTDSSFFFPQTMTLFAHQGHAISEFPLLYWLTGKLYGIFGYHEAIARLVTYSVFLLGVILIFELGMILFKNKWFALIPALALYISPVIVYYALNFLPNVPAFGLTLVSWYFFFRFTTSRNLNYFYLCSIVSLLAALLKPVELFNYAIIVGILISEYLNLFGLKRYSFSKQEIKNILLSIVCVVFITFLWIEYAKGYANAFGYRENLLSIYPIWTMDSESILGTFTSFKERWLYQLLWSPVHYILLGLFFIVIILHKRVNRHLLLAILFLIPIQITYILLFFFAFTHHDYYFLNMFIVAIFVILGTVQIWESFNFNKATSVIACAIIAAILGMSVYHTRFILNERYFGSLQEGINPDIQTITPYLRSIGITHKDIVISIPDRSPNISLYLMNQSGISSGLMGGPETISNYINRGAKYLIVNGPITSHPDWYQPYMKNEIGNYKGIIIYKIAKDKVN